MSDMMEADRRFFCDVRTNNSYKKHITLSSLRGIQYLILSVYSVGSSAGKNSLAQSSVFVGNVWVSLSIESVSHLNLEASVPLAAYDTHKLLHVTSARLGLV